ncbi:MAG: hypothetical protein E6J01_06170 [Chloroflexi bacterium]|nr:MAG: hypothetical protein E6J01_06170 [Chloroflexota bacterium]
MLAEDPAHHRVLLVGPTVDSSNPSAGLKLMQLTMWAWDGADWIQVGTGLPPGPRYDGILAFDQAHRQLVLAGGRTNNANLRDTWIWDGQSWTLKDSDSAPQTEESASAIYDPVSRRVIAFAGPASTFAWDGSRWAQVNIAHSPSVNGLLTRMAVSGRVGGLFTGNGGASFWDWTGSDWEVVWPTGLANWRTYDPTPSPGFKLRLPPYWYSLDGGFSNENVGAPLEMDRNGVWVIASIGSEPCQPPKEVVSASTRVALAGKPAIRYTLPPGGPDGTSGFLVQTSGSSACLALQLLAFDVGTRDANAVLFDEMVSGFSLR